MSLCRSDAKPGELRRRDAIDQGEVGPGERCGQLRGRLDHLAQRSVRPGRLPGSDHHFGLPAEVAAHQRPPESTPRLGQARGTPAGAQESGAKWSRSSGAPQTPKGPVPAVGATTDSDAPPRSRLTLASANDERTITGGQPRSITATPDPLRRALTRVQLSFPS